MKHLAKNIWLKRDGEWSFELVRKKFVKEGDNKGREYFETIGYFSNIERVLVRLKDLGYEEWVNGDVDACRSFIEESFNNAIKSIKE